MIALFENDGGEMLFMAGDDDSGFRRNAKIVERLYRHREYVLRVRLYYSDLSGETAVMMW